MIVSHHLADVGKLRKIRQKKWKKIRIIFRCSHNCLIVTIKNPFWKRLTKNESLIIILDKDFD